MNLFFRTKHIIGSVIGLCRCQSTAPSGMQENSRALLLAQQEAPSAEVDIVSEPFVQIAQSLDEIGIANPESDGTAVQRGYQLKLMLILSASKEEKLGLGKVEMLPENNVRAEGSMIESIELVDRNVGTPGEAFGSVSVVLNPWYCSRIERYRDGVDGDATYTITLTYPIAEGVSEEGMQILRKALEQATWNLWLYAADGTSFYTCPIKLDEVHYTR